MPSRTLSDKLRRVYADINRWRERTPAQAYLYEFMDGAWHRGSRGGAVGNAGILMAIGVGADDHRGVIGVAEGMMGGCGRLAFIRLPAHPARPQGRAHGHRRLVLGAGPHGWRTAAQGELSAVHGTFHA